MKKTVLSLTLLVSIFAFSQKTEIESATKIIHSNPKEAKELLNKAKSQINNSTEPQLLADYHYNLGTLDLKENNILQAAKNFAIVSDLESKGYYEGKNKTTKEKKFYLTEKDAKNAETSGEIEKAKQKTLNVKYTDLISTSLQAKLTPINQEAIKAYENKNFAVAGQKFSEVYFLMKALKSEDPIFYYYSAVAFYSADQKDKSLEVLNDLINLGYTGITTNYTAIDKKTKEVISMKDKAQFDLLKLNPDYTEFKEEKTPSIEGDIYNLVTNIYFEKENFNKALELCEKGLAKVPNHKALSELRGTLYLKSGQSDKFIQSLQDKLIQNPNDESTLYNLGVMYAENPQKHEEAKNYYEKAIAVNPKYTQAYINLAALIIKPDTDIVKEMNTLKNSPAESKKAQELFKKRQELFKQAIPYLEKAYELDPNDESVVSVTKGAYSILENDAKYKEFSLKLKALQAKNK